MDALTLIALCQSLAATGAEPVVWDPALLRRADAWPERMEGGLVTAGSRGLRVEIAPEATWAIAAAPAVVFPEGVRRFRVRVSHASREARWLVRLYGDVRRTGRPATTSLVERGAGPGELTLEPDPRVVRFGGAVQVQLGLEGGPGDWVVFESLEVETAPPPARKPLPEGQLALETVDLMPDVPRPLRIIDWREKARAYDRFVFDGALSGEHLPLVWLDGSNPNNASAAFGLPSYVGDTRGRGSGGQEGVTGMGAVLGASLVGIDKSAGARDWVAMCDAWVHRDSGLALNLMTQETGGSFWYELFPHIVYYALSDRYPGRPAAEATVLRTADRWADAVEAMGGDLDHTAYSFERSEAVDNGLWREPDAAAAIAWLQLFAWERDGQERRLETARRCLRFLQDYPGNAYYEALMPWGALAAARMNAELGDSWDVPALLADCFDLSDVRGGWAVTVQRWGEVDCAGLLGSVDNGGGYAFAMNTFNQAGALVPLARYDTRFACGLGKWMLNLASAARLFYPSELPPGHGCCEWWKGDPEGVIAYEGLRREWAGVSPCGTGDPVYMNWGPTTDLGLYGSSYVGMLGAIVAPTDVEGILRLDCLATDFGKPASLPTSLLWNPWPEERTVTIDLSEGARDLYDAVSHAFVARGVSGSMRVAIEGHHALVLVEVPVGAELTRDGRRLLADGIVVDWGSE